MKIFLSALIVLVLSVVSFGQFQPPVLPTVMGVDPASSTIISAATNANPLIAHWSISSAPGDPFVAIAGPAFSSYSLFVELGPAVPNASFLPGGILNVTSTNGYLGHMSAFPINVLPGVCPDEGTLAAGCGIEFLLLPIQGMSLPAGTVFTIQSVVFNQAYPFGYGVTNPVEYTIIP